MSDENEVEDTLPAEPTGADLAKDFAAQNESEGGDAPAEPAPSTPVEQPDAIPTVDDSQAVDPKYESHLRQMEERFADRERQLNEHLRRYEYELQQLRQTKVEPAKFDVEAWKKLVETDPVAAIAQAAEMKLAPKLRGIEQKFQQQDEFKAQYEQRQFLDRMDRCQGDVQSRYSDFKPGSPVYQAAYRYVQQNAGWLEQAAKRDPNFNPVELAYKHVAHDFLTQKNRAQDAKLVDKRRKAATVVPSATAPVTSTGASSARAAASDLATKGDPVPEKWVQAMERAAKRNDLA